MRDHAVEQNLGAAQVVVIILERLCHAFAHLGVGGEVDHAFDLLGLEQLVEKSTVADIAFVKARTGWDCRAEAGFQIVCHDNVASCLDERARRVRANVTRTA